MRLVALLTDFGTIDPYVGIMKGVLHARAPGVSLVDLTHEIPAQDVRAGALALDAAWRFFPGNTVFLCVVDPGVGTARRPVVARVGDALFVGPDNGLFGLLPSPDVRRIDDRWGLPVRSSTFHGRDLFAPTAAALATGTPFDAVGELVSEPVPLGLPASVDGEGEVLLVDRFGNAITNLPGAASGAVEVRGVRAPVVRTYGEGEPGVPVALTGSTGRLEVAIPLGNAAAELGIAPGTPVRWVPA